MQPAYPTFQRRADGAVLAGVASGLAAHLNVNVTWVRVGFVALTLFGIGQWIYVLVWICSKSVKQGAPIDRKHSSMPLNIMLVVVGLLGSGVLLRPGLPIGLFIALAVIGVGAALAWFAYDRLGTKQSVFTVVLGSTLVFAGVIFGALQRQDGALFGQAVVAVALTLFGVGALAVPFGIRLWEKISEERAEKAAADERAEIASQLHDSVLQTLALIQKRSEEPEVQRLARRQERELRQWLFDPREDATVFTAIERASGEVEDLFGVRIAPVIVGQDVPLDNAGKAAVLAAREAMVNAAKHAGVDTVDVYAERFDELNIFVRDRGPGFDLALVDEDRHGVRESILQRVERAGGTVDIRREGGTEVVIRMPLG